MEEEDLSNIKTLQTKPKTKPKPGCFLGCFGFSGKPKNPAAVDSKKMKRWRLFSWSRKKSAAKTVPIDSSTVSEKIQTGKELGVSKSKPKGKTEKLSSSKRHNTHQSPRQTSGEIAVARETKDETEEKIILESGKHLDQVNSPKVETCQNPLAFRRKIDAIRNGLSQPGSPERKPKSNRTGSPETKPKSNRVNPPETKSKSNRTGSILRSTSFPIPNHQVKKPHKDNDQGVAKKFDPIIGMSIIMVTLVIMLLWGKLCAILCTSAWFYFIPRLSTEDSAQINSISDELDLNSEEYKKRVVLEGLLERNHRSML